MIKEASINNSVLLGPVPLQKIFKNVRNDKIAILLPKFLQDNVCRA